MRIIPRLIPYSSILYNTLKTSEKKKSFRSAAQHCPFGLNLNGKSWARGLTDSRHFKIGAIIFMCDYECKLKVHIKAAVFSLN